MWYKMCSHNVSRQWILQVNNLTVLLRSARVLRKNPTIWRQTIIAKVNSTAATLSTPQILNRCGEKHSNQNSYKVIGGTALFIGLFIYSQLESAKSTTMEEQLPQITEHADELYDSNRMKEAMKYLEKYSDSTSAEVLWRLARVCYKVGKYHSSNNEESSKLATRGMEYAQRALDSDDMNFACHKWMGILISWSSEFEGYKRKIERSFDIRNHFVRAIELNPRDPTCRHLLGQWCYSVSSVPWYHRKVASVIFATPPSSTFEEALSHFEAAEKEEPGFYSTNWLYLGKCHLQLGRIQEGSRWLKKAADYENDVGDDIEAQQEAKALLKKLGVI